MELRNKSQKFSSMSDLTSDDFDLILDKKPSSHDIFSPFSEELVQLDSMPRSTGKTWFTCFLNMYVLQPLLNLETLRQTRKRKFLLKRLKSIISKFQSLLLRSDCEAIFFFQSSPVIQGHIDVIPSSLAQFSHVRSISGGFPHPRLIYIYI